MAFSPRPSGRSNRRSCWAPYDVPKLALIGLVRTLRLEFGPKGLRVSMRSCPVSLVKTEFRARAWATIPKSKTAIKNENPAAPSWARQSDFAGLAVFLASDASRYMRRSGTDVLWRVEHVDVKGQHGTQG